MKLVKYTDITAKDYNSYIQEWEDTGEEIYPLSSERNGMDFSTKVKQWQKEETEAIRGNGWVPAMLYFFLDSDGVIVGAIHFRYELSERLKICGGHIGYGIRSSARRKGYASLMLHEMLAEIRRRGGYEKVLITSDDKNQASIKTIEKNGGVLSDKVLYKNKLIRRYWVPII